MRKEGTAKINAGNNIVENNPSIIVDAPNIVKSSKNNVLTSRSWLSVISKDPTSLAPSNP
jgi:hypothetical protein